MKMRNLSICPMTPDPPEVLELIAELKKYLKTVEYHDAGINEAYFTFDYNGTTYRMDNYALSTPADNLFTAKDYIEDRLLEFGAVNIGYSDRFDW